MDKATLMPSASVAPRVSCTETRCGSSADGETLAGPWLRLRPAGTHAIMTDLINYELDRRSLPRFSNLRHIRIRLHTGSQMFDLEVWDFVLQGML